MLKEDKFKIIAYSFFVLVLLVLSLVLFLRPNITAGVINMEKSYFMPQEIIKGTLVIGLKEGELIPSNTRVHVLVDGELVREMSLKEFIALGNTDLEEQKGSFFVRGIEIGGEGYGYGKAGHFIVYPDVSFQLEITTPNGENEDNATNVTNDFPIMGTFEENASEEPEKNIGGPVENSENIGGSEPLPETPAEEQPSQMVPPGSNEGSSEEASEESESSVNALSVFAIFNRIFSFWSAFVVMDENGNSKVIQGKCNLEEPFYYRLQRNENVALVPGSVKIGEKILDDDTIRLDMQENILTVTTNYFESFEGFGGAYLGDEDYNLVLDLSPLELSFEQEGTRELVIELVYEEKKLVSEAQTIEVRALPVTIKIIDKSGNIEDEILTNNTNIKIKVSKIKIGREIEHELEVENKIEAEASTVGAGITGGAIMEQQPLPESEINFIAMPEEVVIQIDKAPEYSTEVFAIEPSKKIEIESATITLEKTTLQPITRILQCDEWNVEEFKCDSQWKDSGLAFIDNGTHVSFNTTHFTAYIGSGNMTCPYYVHESVVLVESVQCNGTAFIIVADDVEIDCQGHNITYGTSAWGYGINNPGFNNVTIKNCGINGGSGYDQGGIYSSGGQDILIENNTVNGDGILGDNYISNLTIRNNKVIGWGGLELLSIEGGWIYNNTIES
ncbi:MAG: right-handed parallel beta-helix repeat-containing protein, partial [Candidatus Pacearchaeota archaeon]|nr:right-handed parallel beta-helix repeat-containing protein [Candidatus Pacearchaeota archaeon]